MYFNSQQQQRKTAITRKAELSNGWAYRAYNQTIGPITRILRYNKIELKF